MIVAKITQKQAEELTGVQFIQDNYFNPIQDKNGNWIISLQELIYCSVDFANTVELIQYEPIEIEFKA
jgi:hypothetical protein